MNLIEQPLWLLEVRIGDEWIIGFAYRDKNEAEAEAAHARRRVADREVRVREFQPVPSANVAKWTE